MTPKFSLNVFRKNYSLKTMKSRRMKHAMLARRAAENMRREILCAIRRDEIRREIPAGVQIENVTRLA